MTNEQTYKFAKLTKALFRVIFEPIYGASVDFATDYGYLCIDSIKYIILTHDNKNDYYDEKDWVVRISFSCTNSILINNNHPYYKDIKDKVHDFVTEVEQYILINNNHPYYKDIKDKVYDFVTEVEQYI